MKPQTRPIIGVTADTRVAGEAKGGPRCGEVFFQLKKCYFEAVHHAGGSPMLIPPLEPAKRTDAYLDIIDGLIVTGGHFDIDPRLYGETPRYRIDEIKPERTLMEIRLIKRAVRAGMPVLGVCGGQQAINVAFGGTLFQDIPAQAGGGLQHEQKPKPPHKTSHKVGVTRKSRLRKITGEDVLDVNSTHHQAVKDVGRGLTASGVAPDGIIEAIERDGDGPFLLGVQWHPEQLRENDPASRKLFRRFVAAARAYMKARAAK